MTHIRLEPPDLCLFAIEVCNRNLAVTLGHIPPRHPWAIRVSFKARRGARKFFQVGWVREPDYCGRKYPISLRLHCGGIGPLLWCTHRG